MENETQRRQLEIYAKKKYDIEPEQLPFNHEDYAILRHSGNGKWFAVFIVKPRSELRLKGNGDAEIVSVKLRDSSMVDMLAHQSGFLQGYPNPKWKWISIVLDGTIPFEDICQWLDESYQATKSKAQNKKVALLKRDFSIHGRNTDE